MPDAGSDWQKEVPASALFDREHLRSLLMSGIHPTRRKIEAPLVAQIEGVLVEALDDPDPFGAATARLSVWVSDCIIQIDKVKQINAAFNASIAQAPDAEARRLRILDYARALGAGARQLRGDAKAFRRWFGLDAVAERSRRRIALTERQAAFGLNRLSVLAVTLMSGMAEMELRGAWRRSRIEQAVTDGLNYIGDARVRTAALSCLREVLRSLPAHLREDLLGEATLRRVYRVASQPNAEAVEAQIHALELLRLLSVARFQEVLSRRIAKPSAGDDFWVRRHAVGMLCKEISDAPRLAELLPLIRKDPSPAVRQSLALHLEYLPEGAVHDCLIALACEDDAPEVRGAAVRALTAIVRVVDVRISSSTLKQVLQEETNDFVLRVALDVAATALQNLDDVDADDWVAFLVPEMETLRTDAPSLAVRRWAAQSRERIWCWQEPRARELNDYLRGAVEGKREGSWCRIGKIRQTVREQPHLVARVLSVMAQTDFGFDLHCGGLGVSPKIRRGDRFVFRAWRAWYEFRHPSPDKRQAFPHTIGRVFSGRWHAPSTVMAELAQTKVPGEPFFIGEEAGWRPYLPLPDHALSAIDTGSTVRIVTSEGITEMTPPKGFLRRVRSRILLSLRFSEVAHLRNWTPARSHAPSSYLEALADLGFSFKLLPHEKAEEQDRSVLRFFPAASLVLIPPGFWGRFESYSYSVYQNTLRHLAIFLAAVLLWFFGRHIWVNARMRRTRAALPLVLGGWGTRGKSGTERIKAALINALGYSLVSKTTGNEAMFLYGFPFGPVKEMFLFRPYDKATIWEQEQLARLATKLKGDVFLWECMGLTPGYVKVLQRHWMRDDISTITNTYPDHEDLQGPAGRNIPEVMTNFIPRKGRLLTTEEQMRPILANAARDLGTSIDSVGWLEAGLLPSDALRRFPYEEHPLNIALVLRMAREIGVDSDFALREMADRVVPDIGVLKAYPITTMRRRRMQFVMGNSANEKFGALGNWRRMGFDQQDAYAEPGVLLTAVVNNRADRVPRSRVFADLVVNDVSLDLIVLIGSNLEGMQGYIDEALEARLEDATLWPEMAQEGSEPREVLEAVARHLRIPYRNQHVVDRLRAALEGLDVDLDVEALLPRRDDHEHLRSALAAADVAEAEDLLLYLAEMQRTVREYKEMLALIGEGGDRERLNRAFRNQVKQWFQRKITVVEDFYASGNKVIDVACQVTPPGIFNRTIGMQNIKGTGLDFVYRWQAWETVHSACEKAESSDSLVSAEGLQTLLTFQEFGIAAEERVQATVARLRARDGDRLGPQLDLISASLEEQLAEVRQEMNILRSGSRIDKIIEAVEAFLDAGDAVRRRKKANRIYRDMVTERISHERAARELKHLNSRQKGGWLSEEIAGLIQRIRQVARA